MVVRPAFWIVLILFVLSLFFGSAYQDATLFRLSYVWGLLLIGGYLWARVSLYGLKVNRIVRTQRQQVGQIFEERFEVTNQVRMARLWLAVKDASTLPGVGNLRVLTWIGAQQRRSYISYSYLTRRGLFTCGPTLLSSGDLFGMYRQTVEFPGTNTVLVFPYLADIESFPLPPGLLQGGRSLRRRTLEVTPHSAGVREYAPGDALNQIHWPTTARRDQLMVKEFDQDPQADVWIILDAKKSVQVEQTDPRAPVSFFMDRLWWTKGLPEFALPPSTLEYGVSIAGSIAQYYIHRGQAVGFASAGQVYTALSPERGDRQLAKVLETLALIEGEGNLSLFGLVSSLYTQFTRGSVIILVTPAVHSEIIYAVDDLTQRRMYPVVTFIDAHSFGGREIPQAVVEGIQARKVPVISVAKDDHLEKALNWMSPGMGSVSRWWAESTREG